MGGGSFAYHLVLVSGLETFGAAIELLTLPSPLLDALLAPNGTVILGAAPANVTLVTVGCPSNASECVTGDFNSDPAFAHLPHDEPLFYTVLAANNVTKTAYAPALMWTCSYLSDTSPELGVDGYGRVICCCVWLLIRRRRLFRWVATTGLFCC